MLEPAPPRIILGFDSWSQGRAHYARIASPLKQLGFQLILVHLGSWGHDSNTPLEELDGDLIIRDIRYYGNCSFYRLLDRENPSSVIFLSTRSLPHQAMNRYALMRGIPTVHLFHGIYCAAPPMLEEPMFEVSVTKNIPLYVEKIWRNLRHVLPCYIRSLIRSRAGLEDWKQFFREVASRLGDGTGKSLPSDVKTSIGCVYVLGDRAEMRQYHLADDEIFAVGNPDCRSFGFKQEMLGSWRPGNGNREIVYIETALLAYGIRFSSENEYIAHLDAIAAAIRPAGFRLAVKPHPASARSGLDKAIARAGYRLCTSEDFVPSLMAASAAMTEPSAAGAIPAMLGMPVLLVSCGKLEGRGHGRMFNDYPGSIRITDMSQLAQIGELVETPMAREAHATWVREFAAPQPAELMPERVAAIVNDLMASRHNVAIVG